MGQREGAILTRRQVSALWGDRPSSGNGHEGVASVEGQRKTTKLIEIKGEYGDIPVAFVGDAGYIVGGDGDEIRRWQVNDGKEAGQPVNAGSEVCSIAASRDGKWIVCGTWSGQVVVWDAESHKKVSEFRGHDRVVYAVDISPDAMRVASGSWDDGTVRVWSRSTGEKLLGPLKHRGWVAAVKFSPDGQFIATATWERESIRVYDSRDGRLLFDSLIKVGWFCNQSLAWDSDSKQLFALSGDGKVHCLDVANGRILSEWAIHSNNFTKCIALAINGAFIAASARSSVSFWDTATCKQIGPLIHHPGGVWYMAISANDDLVLSGEKKIVLQKLPNILPSSFFDLVGVFRCQRDAIHHDSLGAADTQSHLPVG